MPARLLYSFMCDATASIGGKMTYYGVFDRFLAKDFPTLHPSCVISGNISATPGEHALVIRFKRMDATDYIPETPQIKFQSQEFAKNDINLTIVNFPLLLGTTEQDVFVTLEWLVDQEKIGETEIHIARQK